MNGKGLWILTGITISIIIVFIFGLIETVKAPIVGLPENWDCSNTAAYVFKQEQRLGHEPTLVVGYNTSENWGHAYVSDEDGNVLTGGDKEWLDRTLDIIHKYKELPELDVSGRDMTSEWETTF